MENEQNNTKINVRDWIILSTTMIGAVLTILALIWQFKPSYGIITVTFLLLLSFILFVNSVSANSKANFEIKSKRMKEKQIFRFVSFAEYTFGLGFTLVITAFSILGYKYFIDFAGRSLIALILPISFMIVTWIMIFIYNTINYSGRPLKSFRSLKRNLWILMEMLCLFCIILDFFEIILIP
ncbi:MAG: hypothetical protein ACFFFB_04685 [Candidatus Heimdallarchaeota archaeon]